jgi:ribonuclease D
VKLDDPAIHVYRGDLPHGLRFASDVAVDTEAMGLNPHRDRLCLLQLSAGDGVCHLVQFPPPEPHSGAASVLHTPNLSALFSDPNVTKLFHFARFDLGMIYRYLGVICRPVYCTKIASRLARTYTDRHSLKELCRELLDIDLPKEQQSSDWGASELTGAQLQYAARDVVYLHVLRQRLDAMLARENRTELAEACFRFLPFRARLDVDGWPNEDIFAY